MSKLLSVEWALVLIFLALGVLVSCAIYVESSNVKRGYVGMDGVAYTCAPEKRP